MEWYYLVPIGFIAGIFAGVLGIGGGTIFTPVLFIIFSGVYTEPHVFAVGTSLFCTFITSTGALSSILAQKKIALSSAFTIAIFGMFGTQMGKFVLTRDFFNATIFSWIFTSMLIITALNYLRKVLVNAPPVEKSEGSKSFPADIATGLAGGTLATIAGVGGGIVMVPLINLFRKISMHLSVHYSQFAIFFISLAGFSGFLFDTPDVETGKMVVGFVDFGTALPLVLTAFIGSRIGIQIGPKIPPRILAVVFGVYCVAIAIKLNS